jgi:rubrerythrin
VQDLSGSEGEVDEAVADTSRRRFLALAAPAAAGGMAAFLAACGSSSDPQTASQNATKAQSPTGGHDLEIVNYALTLEHIEADFYDRVVERSLFSGAEGDLFKLIQSNEHEHVAALQALARKLGGPVADRPQTQFPLGSPRAALTLAATLENTGAAAYLGQIDSIENKEVLAQALSIHSIEARHAAKLSRMLGEDFTPDGAFASSMDMGEVMDAVRPFIV